MTSGIPTSVTPIERTASATGVPCATSTSTWRSLDTISSGLCLFLDMGSVLLRLSRAIPQGGPLQWGRISQVGPGQELVETAVWMAVDDAGDHVRQIGPRPHPGQLANRESMNRFPVVMAGSQGVCCGSKMSELAAMTGIR